VAYRVGRIHVTCLIDSDAIERSNLVASFGFGIARLPEDFAFRRKLLNTIVACILPRKRCRRNRRRRPLGELTAPAALRAATEGPDAPMTSTLSPAEFIFTIR
jgi:hypothetical protein